MMKNIVCDISLRLKLKSYVKPGKLIYEYLMALCVAHNFKKNAKLSF